MTWWQRLFYGFNTTGNKTESKSPWDTIGEGTDAEKDAVISPKFVSWLRNAGFRYTTEKEIDRDAIASGQPGVWYRCWTCCTPTGPEIMWETFSLNQETRRWTTRIINPDMVGSGGGGGSVDGWCVWREDWGEKT